ncbi:PREDICTED: pre-mRNA-splicing factor 38B-like isoform X2 [Acropora digitifera]|uniref:pre-mRNA-splicing factor 38B-like isoform X2 n=1 Tax=Acropora digitifera TaxID=70779 RepID=UPI00077AEBC0|nr:PREDICTED: pre-mRNA-splicing factor 38B-like isoform X2 [Acropora digitifera]
MSRYCQPPNKLWEWMEPFLEDEEEVDPKAGGGCTMTIGQMVRSFLLKLEWYGTLFPRIPVPVQKDIEVKLREKGLCDDHKRTAQDGWGEAEDFVRRTRVESPPNRRQDEADGDRRAKLPSSRSRRHSPGTGTETETEKEDEVEVVIAIVPEGEVKSTEDAKIVETETERKGEVEAQARKGETKIGKDEAEAEIETEKEGEAEIATILEEEGAKRKRETGGKIARAADK